jgi:hypothetical protein
VSICGQEAAEGPSYSLFFDTGSNMLILPPQAYARTREIVNEEMRKLGCLEQPEHFSYFCPSAAKTDEKLVFLLDGSGSCIELRLDDLVKGSEGNVKLLIGSGGEGEVFVGGSLMREYLLSFHLEGQVRVFKSNAS